MLRPRTGGVKGVVRPDFSGGVGEIRPGDCGQVVMPCGVCVSGVIGDDAVGVHRPGGPGVRGIPRPCKGGGGGVIARVGGGVGSTVQRPYCGGGNVVVDMLRRKHGGDGDSVLLGGCCVIPPDCGDAGGGVRPFVDGVDVILE